MNATFYNTDTNATQVHVERRRAEAPDGSRGKWMVRLGVSGVRPEADLDPAQARAIAAQIVASAEEVEELRRRDPR